MSQQVFQTKIGRVALLCAAAVAWSAPPPRGGVLRVAQRTEPKTLNPVTAIDAPSREVLRRLHADLISIDRVTQRTEPALAESSTQSADGREFAVRLRKGLRFSDGHPFNADDVLFSFAVYEDPAVASPQRDLLMVHGKPIEVRKVDDLTVAFQTAAPYAVTDRLFDSVPMLPRHKLEAVWRAGKLREAWAVTAAPAELAGLGPFRLKHYVPGEHILLERNPYYYRRLLPHLDGLDFRFLPDEDLQLARFVSGDLDMLSRLNPQAISYLESRHLPATDLGPGLAYEFVCLNLSGGAGEKTAWFQKPEFKRALSLAVDRDAMARLIFRGRAAPLWGHVSPGNKLWFHAGLARPPRDVSAAKKLLAEAGFREDGGVLKDRAGHPVEFSMLVSASSPERVQMASMLREDWKSLGISMTPAPLEFRSLIERVLTSRQFEACLLGLGGGDADPNPELNVWLSSGAMHLWNPGQKQPATSWERELDELMQRQMTTLNYAARKRLYDRAQQIIAWEAPMIFLLSPHVVVAQNGRVGNFRPAILDHQTLWNVDELFLEPKR